MECKPFNVDVMLVTTGGIKSRLFTNQSTSFALPSDSLYTRFHANILDSIERASMAQTMTADQFATKVVSKALSRNTGLSLRLGAHSMLFYFWSWLPCLWVLNLFWWGLSRPKK